MTSLILCVFINTKKGENIYINSHVACHVHTKRGVNMLELISILLTIFLQVFLKLFFVQIVVRVLLSLVEYLFPHLSAFHSISHFISTQIDSDWWAW